MKTDFQTIPLRFRVWDKVKKRWYCPKEAFTSERFIYDALHKDWIVEFYAEDDGPERFIISQDTGFKDQNGETIYTGDIIYDPAVELNGYVYYLESEASLMVRYEDGDVNYLSPRVGEPAVIKKGNIWEDYDKYMKQCH